MICVSCEIAIWERAHPNIEMCRHCWNTLPEITRQAFKSGTANAKRVGAAARMRTTTATQLRAGRHSQK